MRKGKYQHGKYLVSASPEITASIIEWICSGTFEAFEREQFRFDQAGRPRNKLFAFFLPPVGRHVVMKVFHIYPGYTRLRRIHLLFNQYFKDYNKIAFKGCHALYKSGFATAAPIAYWNFRRSFFNPKSYFLYEKIEAEYTLADLYDSIRKHEGDASPSLDDVKRRMVSTLKDIHAAGFRHSDLNPGNILVNTLEPRCIKRMPLHFVDYDSPVLPGSRSLLSSGFLT